MSSKSEMNEPEYGVGTDLRISLVDCDLLTRVASSSSSSFSVDDRKQMGGLRQRRR